MRTLFAASVSISAALVFAVPNIAQAQQTQGVPSQAPNTAPNHDTKRASLLTKNAKTMLDAWSAAPGDVDFLVKASQLLAQAQEANDQYAPIFLQIARYDLLMQYANRATTGKSYADEAIAVSQMATNHALEIDPKLSDAYVFLADIFQIAGDLKKSAANLDTAEKLGCKSPWLNIQRAVLVSRTPGANKKTVLDNLSIALKRAEKMQENKAIETAAYGITAYFKDLKQEKMAAIYLKKAEQARRQLANQAKAIAASS